MPPVLGGSLFCLQRLQFAPSVPNVLFQAHIQFCCLKWSHLAYCSGFNLQIVWSSICHPEACPKGFDILDYSQLTSMVTCFSFPFWNRQKRNTKPVEILEHFIFKNITIYYNIEYIYIHRFICATKHTMFIWELFRSFYCCCRIFFRRNSPSWGPVPPVPPSNMAAFVWLSASLGRDYPGRYKRAESVYCAFQMVTLR